MTSKIISAFCVFALLPGCAAAAADETDRNDQALDAIRASDCAYTPTSALPDEVILDTVQLRERSPMGTANGTPYTVSLVRSTNASRVGPPTLSYHIRKSGGACQGEALLGRGSIPDRGGAHFIAAVPHAGQPTISPMPGYVLMETSPLVNGPGTQQLISVDFATGARRL